MTENYLRFWGVRGSYPAPFDSHCKVGGNTSCVEIRVGDQILVCDAGSGIIPLGNELMKQDGFYAKLARRQQLEAELESEFPAVEAG